MKSKPDHFCYIIARDEAADIGFVRPLYARADAGSIELAVHDAIANLGRQVCRAGHPHFLLKPGVVVELHCDYSTYEKIKDIKIPIPIGVRVAPVDMERHPAATPFLG